MMCLEFSSVLKLICLRCFNFLVRRLLLWVEGVESDWLDLIRYLRE